MSTNSLLSRRTLKKVGYALAVSIVVYYALYALGRTYGEDDLVYEIINDRNDQRRSPLDLNEETCFIKDSIAGHDRLLLMSTLDSSLRVHRTALVENQSAEFLSGQTLVQRVRLALSGSARRDRERVVKASNELANREGITTLEHALEACGREQL